MFDNKKSKSIKMAYKKPEIIVLGALKLETLGKNSYSADKDSTATKFKKP